MENYFDILKEMVKNSDLLKQLFMLMDLMPNVSFYVKDTDGNYVALNRTAWEYCGVQERVDACGKGDKDYFSPERVALYKADEDMVLNTGKPIIQRIEPAPEMEGSPQLVETNKFPVKDKSGNIIGLIGFHRRMNRQQHFSSGMGKLGETVDYMHKNAMGEINYKELAQITGVSESKFGRIFREKLGVSPRQYIKRVRIENACRLLLETDVTVTTVAQECGFYDHAHFTRAFTSSMGISPSSYRKERLGKS